MSNLIKLSLPIAVLLLLAGDGLAAPNKKPKILEYTTIIRSSELVLEKSSGNLDGWRLHISF